MKTIKLSQYGIVISPDKVNAIHEEMRAGVGEPITLDFKDVKGIDSAAAHELLKSMRGHKGALVQMKNASPMVKSVMMYSSGATVSSGKARKRFLGLIMLAAMLMLGIGQAWGTDVTFATSELTDGNVKGGIVVVESSSSSNTKICTSSNVSCIVLSTTADANYNSSTDNRIAFKVRGNAGTITGITIHGSTNSSTTNATANGPVIFWNDTTFPNTAIGYSDVAFKSYVQTNTCTNHYYNLTPPSGTTAFAIYKRVKFNTETNAVGGSESNYGGNTTLRIDEIVITLTPAGGGDPEPGCTSHSVNLNSSGSVTGGTFATSSSTVCEGETATLTATPAAGYVFTSWSALGTGSSLSSTTTNPTTLTMGTADVSVNATFTKVYASGTYTFYGNTTVGSSPSKTVTTTATDYDAFRIDNLFFSSTNIQYESGSGSTESNDYYGWKVKKSSTIKFFVEDDSDVKICIGTIGGGTCTVSYTDHSSVAHNNTSISSGSHETYEVKGGTMVTLSMAPSSSKSVTLKQIMITPSVSCTAPNHVDITASAEVDGYGRYTIGETISLTATAYSSAGTGSPIISGITGYQWQKYVGNAWEDLTDGGNISGATTANLQISSCTASNVGSYQCIVSTGDTCSTTSNSKMVRVYSLDGNYYGVAWTKNAITWTGNKTGTVTLNLDAKQVYEFKIRDNDGKEYGSGADNYVIQSGDSKDCGTGNVNVRLLTAPAGNYTFTIDITHAQDGSPYVNVVTNYPTVSHPNTGYVYVQKFGWTPRLHYWYDNDHALTAWDNDPTINADQYVNICGTDYWYVPVINYYCNFIASDHGSNSTGDQHTNDSHPGQRLYNDGSWKWDSFTTYTITYAANGGGGSMTATSGICPDANQAITSNAFTAPSGCASFSHWTANVNVKVGGNTITAGDPIANGATIQNINSNITLTAVWKLETPTITDNGDNTFSISGSIGGATYYYTTNNSTPTTSSSSYSSAVDFSAGEADITAKAIAHKTGYVDSDVASQACTYHAPATTVTATWPMVVNDAFSAVGSATNASITPSNATKAGSNIGDFNTVIDATFTDYSGKMAKIPATGTIGSSGSVTDDHYIKYSITVASGYKFKPTGFSATVGRFATDNGYAQAVLKTGATTIKSSAASKPSRSGQSVAKTVYSAEFDDASEYAAGTVIDLYIYLGGGLASSKYYGIVAVSITGEYEAVACSEPAAPTGLTNGAKTANTQVVTWTANGEDTWEVYHSTSSSTPGTDQTPTATVNSATYTFTGLTASTQYYWWARAKCDATHKSAWVAGTSFTTSAAGYTVTYDGSGAGGGAVPVDGSSPYTSGSTVTVLGNTGSLTRTIGGSAATFLGWNTNSNTYGGTHYDEGDQFSMASSNVTLYAVWGFALNYNTDGGTINDDPYATYYISIYPDEGEITVLPTNVTKTGYTFAGWKTQNGSGSTVTAIDGNYTGAFAGDYALKAMWTAKTTTITINANTSNHGSTTPGTVTATYGSALPSFTAATGASGWNLTGYFTAPTSGTKVINANGTLVASTDYADGSGNWKYETATLTLYAQYEEEGCTPTTASITFNNNVAGKYNTNWGVGDITTSGGATYTLTNTSCDTGHPMTKPAIKGAKNTTLIQINIPAGATSGTISVSAATYNGDAATLAITNSGGTTLASQSLSSTTTNADAGSWSAPTLKTASYNITSGGTYYIKETSNSNNIYIYAFSATAEVPCDETAPTFVSSVPANGATGVATSGTIVLTFSEALGSVDASKFTLTGATKGAVSIDGSDATKVNIAYSGAANEATVTLATAAAAVSDLAGNTLAAALSNISFTTAAAEPEALVHWTLNLNSNTWGTSTTPTTTDGTNITSISTSADSEDGTREGTTKKVSLASASDNVDKAASFTFTVNSAKKVEPERVTCQVFNVGGSSGGQLSYKAQLSDNNGHIYYSTNTVVPASEAKLTDATFTFASDLVLTGNVTIKVYGWKSGSAGSAFRMGADVKLFGEVQNAADYTVTHALSNVTKSAGATSVKEGNNYTATYAASSGYTLPSTITVAVGGATKTAGTDYTWNQETGVVTIPGNVVTGNIVITVTGVATVHHNVTFSLTNVVYSIGDNQGTDAATEGLAFSTIFAASSGYDLPSTITVTIGGSPATVSTDYTWNSSTGALEILAASVTGDIVVTIVGPEHVTSDCITITHWGTSNATTEAWAGSIAAENKYRLSHSGGSTSNNKSTDSNASILLYYGTTMSIYDSPTETTDFENVTSVSFKVKLYSASKKPTITVSVGSGAGETVTLTENSDNSTFQTYTVNFATQQTGAVKLRNNGSGDSGYKVYIDDVQICTASMSACTTPIIPSLSNQALCEGANAAAWDATVTNAAAISAAGETVSYQWQLKNGSNWDDISGATSASYDVSDAVTEAMAGTYRVVVTVSKAGYSSSSATSEVTLSVTEATEVTGITADKATVYPGNSVTLTATANTTVTWQWYTCTNAEGAGESSISGATSASYTIASAGAAGTYYYKAKGTSSCGTGERVYTLTVSEASGGDCFHFVSVIPASDFNASSGASLVTPTHATTLEGGTMKVGSQQVTFTKDYGLKMEGTKTVSITLDAALEAGNVVIVKGTSGSKGYGITINGVNFYDADNKTFDVSYTVLADDGLVGKTALTVSKYSGSSYLQEVKITGCGESCTDPEVTASVSSSTACEGSSVTFTASDAHASATYQWQKLDGTWGNISGATSATYTIASVTGDDETKYRVIASHDCNRTSNEVSLNVAAAPDFGSTVPASVSVMQTLALSINTVEATDAVNYIWYKSADAIWDAGDTEIGTTKNLIKAYADEAVGSPSYYIFCRASNSCGSTTSTPIAVNVTTYVEEDCATRGNEGDAEFSFENSGASQGSYESTPCWTMNSNSKILVYYPPTGKYFKTAKVTIASSSASKASYNWSTNGGTTYTEGAISSLTTTLTEKTIDLSAHGNVNAFQIGRNLDGNGESSGTLYVSNICFEYTDACTATTVTPSTASKTHTIGDAFTAPTFTLAPAAVSGGTLSYSSSDEDIASVDSETGAVTFNGRAGEVTITASYAGATISETDYCASEGSYTITVSCAGGAPKIVADGSVNMSGCNTSVTLNAKQSDGTTDFTGGSYQWFRNGEEIDDATGKSITVTQSGTYTVEYTSAGGCTSLSSNSATVTSESTEPEIERLTPFQYYHVDSVYHESSIMRYRHLFTVKNSAEYNSTGKKFKMELSRNGAAATDVTAQSSIVVTHNGDNTVDTVLLDLNALRGKYSEGDELVLTCKAVDCAGNVSESYKDDITVYVIDNTPTLALICSGSSKAGGTRKTGELTVGGDFLTGYNVADLCQQTGNTSFDKDTEWGLYTDLKARYKVTPVNGYAVFNKLNYEPFDVLLLTDYPKASKSDAAKDVLDDMAALCDYRPMLSFKTHMVAKSPSKWAEKGFTTSPVVTKADGRLNLNIVCYAHPMFESLKTGEDVYTDVGNTSAPLVYTMLSGTGYESSKGMQGFELAAAENFVTIGLTHYNATIAKNSPLAGEVEWTPGSEDRMLVTVAERQANPEARFILFSLNCGAQSKLTDRGEQVVLACLNYLLGTAEGTIEPADCSFTFDNGEGNERTPEQQATNCPSCPPAGDHKWSNPANWGPDYRLLPGEFTSVRIKKPVEVDDTHAHVMEVRIIEEGRIDIPANKGLDVKSTIRRMDGSEIYPTDVTDIHIGSASTGNGTLIFNNDDGDTKATVWAYSKGFIDGEGVKNYQYIGTPFQNVNALYNYYGSWIYSWGYDENKSKWRWIAVKNGGPMHAWTGYCISQEAPTYYETRGTLTATNTVDIDVPAGGDMVVGNSWTAPIDINAFTNDDFENLNASVYFFNTGVDKDHTMTGHEQNLENRYAGSTYVTVPIHSAPYTGDDHIPSLQGFFVTSSGSAGTLHLDYDRHVRGTTRDNISSGALHAPRRAKAAIDEPTVLKIKVSGENYDDKLVLLAREDFSTGFDNGWDGDKWDGNESALYIYTKDEEGTENSVSAVPELEGTVIGFRAGEDEAYTLNFEYLNSDEPLYLYDIDLNTYTEIRTGITYRFFTNDKEKHERFIITLSNGQEIGTGVEPTSDSSLKGRAKKLIIEDKMYILVNGMLYDATGKVVK